MKELSIISEPKTRILRLNGIFTKSASARLLHKKLSLGREFFYALFCDVISFFEAIAVVDKRAESGDNGLIDRLLVCRVIKIR